MSEDLENKNIWFGLLMAIIAKIIFTILNILGLLVSVVNLLIKDWKNSDDRIGELLFKSALSDDQKSNVVLGPIMNSVFISKETLLEVNGVRLTYGHQDDTISDITGRLYMVGGLSDHGLRLRKILNYVLGEDHCVLSVSDEIVSLLKKI